VQSRCNRWLIHSAEQFATGSLEGAVSMIVFGADGEQARTLAGEIAKSAFHNVSFFGGTVEELMQGIQE
jgi:hypothetical protein